MKAIAIVLLVLIALVESGTVEEIDCSRLSDNCWWCMLQGCSWCESRRACVPTLGSERYSCPGGLATDLNCPGHTIQPMMFEPGVEEAFGDAYCLRFDSCRECASQEHCIWCHTTQTCLSAENPHRVVVLSCPTGLVSFASQCPS
jgi:hypothetical protein